MKGRAQSLSQNSTRLSCLQFPEARKFLDTDPVLANNFAAEQLFFNNAILKKVVVRWMLGWCDCGTDEDSQTWYTVRTIVKLLIWETNRSDGITANEGTGQFYGFRKNKQRYTSLLNISPSSSERFSIHTKALSWHFIASDSHIASRQNHRDKIRLQILDYFWRSVDKS